MWLLNIIIDLRLCRETYISHVTVTNVLLSLIVKCP